MRPVSDALLDIVTGSHTARTRIRSCIGFPQSTTPTTTSAPFVLGGSVRMDSSAQIRATLDATIVDDWGGLLPSGVELFVEYGVAVAGGSTEWVSLGYFRLETITQSGINGPIQVTGSDRMAQVIDTEAVFPWVVPAGTSHEELFQSLLYGQPSPTWFHPNAGVFPVGVADTAILFDYDAASETIPFEIPLDKNFYDILQGVADTRDKRMFFDYLGRLNVVDADVFPENPVHTISAGVGGTLRDVTRQITREGVYNSVRAEGSAPTEGDPPWNYVVSPIAPVGPLSWYSRFGRVLKTYASPLLNTSSEALSAAQTYFDKVTGLPYTLSLACTANPALEPLDVIAVKFPGLLAGDFGGTPPRPGLLDPVTEVHVVDSLTFPLMGGDMAVTTRGTTIGGV